MKSINNVLSQETLSKIDLWTKKFPENQKRSALLQSLMISQQQNNGFLTSALIEAVADYLDLPHVWAYEVASFYDMYALKPSGKHKIRLCTNISCMLRGSDKVATYLKNKLAIDFGQTTQNGKCTLIEAECLAACCEAPAMQVDLEYYGHLNEEIIDKILEEKALL